MNIGNDTSLILFIFMNSIYIYEFNKFLNHSLVSSSPKGDKILQIYEAKIYITQNYFIKLGRSANRKKHLQRCQTLPGRAHENGTGMKQGRNIYPKL